MHEQPPDSAGAGVQVLVRTPRRSVHVPVVKFQGNVTDCVGEVPDDEDAAGLCVGGDSLDVEELAGVELDTW